MFMFDLIKQHKTIDNRRSDQSSNTNRIAAYTEKTDTMTSFPGNKYSANESGTQWANSTQNAAPKHGKDCNETKTDELVRNTGK